MHLLPLSLILPDEEIGANGDFKNGFEVRKKKGGDLHLLRDERTYFNLKQRWGLTSFKRRMNII